MASIYNYLKTVFQNLKQEYSQNPAVIFIILILWSIPLRYAFGSISIALLFVFSIYTLKRSNLKFQKNLILPIALFLLMGGSLIWTHDLSASLRALSKGLPLLIFPICFLLIPTLTQSQKQKIFQFYSYGIVFYVFFYLIKATMRFFISSNSNVFFYHELVTEEVNAIHVSVYVAMAAFYFLTKTAKTTLDKFLIVFLTFFLILLSSKNIIIIFFVLIVIYYLGHYKSSQKSKFLRLGVFFILISAVIFSGKIKERFLIEFNIKIPKNF